MTLIVVVITIAYVTFRQMDLFGAYACPFVCDATLLVARVLFHLNFRRVFFQISVLVRSG